MSFARCCPICAAELRADFATSRLAVWRCSRCAHRLAEHLREPASGDGDYHLQYEQVEFVAALERTRVRQARAIIAMIEKHLGEADKLLDFGAGRGWLLQTARAAGFRHLAGADSSELAGRLLREHGFESLHVVPGAVAAATLPAASFRPDVLTLLDVLEHFPAEHAAQTLASLVSHFRPRLMVVKVPISSGLLYRAARGLCAFGSPAALEQLYQVGSQPPHLSYFSKASLRTLLKSCRLELLEARLDLDFEPKELSRRARALRDAQGLAQGLGMVAGLSARALGLQDSLIALARVSDAALS